MYDLIVLGGGPAGYLASERAGHAGLKVLLIEKRSVGGVCLNEGCIPTKTLLYSAKLYDGVVHGEKYGVSAEGLNIDHAKVIARKDKVVKTLVAGVKSALKANDVEVVSGEAKVLGNTSGGFRVACGESEYEGERLLIATGSNPAVPPIPGLKEGLESGFVLTNREALQLTQKPASLVVIGGGVIGLELASYFNSIGADITVVEALDHIAGENDQDLVALLKKSYEKKGIKFLLSTKVVSIGGNAGKSTVECEANGETLSLEADKVLLSIGRRANSFDLGLDSIGVVLERGAVITDSHMRTNIKNVYAAGDVNGKSMLAHTAYREAEVAINDILGIADEMRYDAIPAVIYTNPELGSVGLTEASAAKSGVEIETVKLPMRFAGRYLAENEGGDGIMKLIVGKADRRILGAQVLANYASEFIVAAASYIELGLTVDDVKKIVFPHPTVSEILREAVFQA